MKSTLLKTVPQTARRSSMAGSCVVAVRSGLLDARSQKIKRVTDILLALCLIVLALPLALAFAAAIVLETRGPVFFAHTRIGKGGRRFRMWKFRSMVVDADVVLKKHLDKNREHLSEWLRTRKLKCDPRVTRVGWLLRRSSLDELPQLWNVLRGDMSMVGPRPIVQEEIARYGPVFPLYSRVTPGLTGLWQVSGRNDTSYRERIALDAQYIRNWSLWGDLRVLLRTVRVVICGHGAY
ncbi:MAG: exopolysaccharide biosynthesis polyprenyl glycosylphosphotransferase [Acidobacteria bacterium]|nr:exopolysaccharide biosynthesis polyprenyl glycosylphosphotransferase [Acidobacteriota bacterium]